MKHPRTTSSLRPRFLGGSLLEPLHVVIVGCGNIGSHAVPLAARLPGLRRLTLVDFDRYEASNLRSQAMTTHEVGKPKAWVQARRARAIDPQVEVSAIVDRLENIPMGRLRGSVLLTCLDGNEARRRANELAWRLGMVWIDAGVEPSLWLVRVDVYFPGARQPCIECGWQEQDYDRLKVRGPCDRAPSRQASTGAPACLGALAAGLQLIECSKLLNSTIAPTTQGYQIVMEARHHQTYVTRLHRNPSCRFPHVCPPPTTLKRGLAQRDLNSVFRLGGSVRDSRLGLGGMALAMQLACPGCGLTRPTFHLLERMSPHQKTCPRCQRELLATGTHTFTSVVAGDLAEGDRTRSLARLGFAAGDFISLTRKGRTRWLELGGDSQSSRAGADQSRRTR